jgi:predicted CXXCH cytochrome family protein
MQTVIVFAMTPDVNKANQPCIGCHQQALVQWQHSDHARSMAKASKDTVLGDFANVSVSHYRQQASFYKQGQDYWVDISYGEQKSSYRIDYTFGFYPLQQYLVETEPGRMQVLPFAWDSRSAEQGGQRWYHNYADEEITAADRLHWRQPLQNWNGMCADCHSDALLRGYDQNTKRFNSHWQGISVGCISCHGDDLSHGKAPVEANVKVSAKSPDGHWLLGDNQDTAHWQGKARDNRFMENCFACHSLRSPLTDGFKANQPFLEQFTPQLVAAPLYYADGQIKEEVYVYGSFLQSKMYGQGVNCLDCHDAHTMKVKGEGNQVCLQCHKSQTFNTVAHHKHPQESQGALCVNCHMPSNRYMGVDDRRDHRFKLPRPNLTAKLATPNACQQCHQQQGNSWIVDKFNALWPEHKALSASEQSFIRLNSGQGLSLSEHLAMISDSEFAVISRASALQLLYLSTSSLSHKQLQPYLTANEPLLRLAAAQAAILLVPDERFGALRPLLADEYKAIRIAAARTLLDSQLLVKNSQAFNRAVSELQYSNALGAWRGEGRLNQAMANINQQRYTKAEQDMLAAVSVDPYMEAAYINLAQYYRMQQQNAKVTSVLQQGMAKLPANPMLAYEYGLHLVRQSQHGKAHQFFVKAFKLAPDSGQFAYGYLLSLDGQGQTAKALAELKTLIAKFKDNTQLKELGLYLAQKNQDNEAYHYFRRL